MACGDVTGNGHSHAARCHDILGTFCADAQFPVYCCRPVYRGLNKITLFQRNFAFTERVLVNEAMLPTPELPLGVWRRAQACGRRTCPPALWLSHFAACLPDLPQTSPYLVQAPPPLYTRPPSQSTGPSPSPSCLAQTSTIYTDYTNLINDSLRNLIKRKTYRESRTQPSFFTLLLNT